MTLEASSLGRAPHPHIAEAMRWTDVQEYLQHDTRVVIPMGALEEHGPLSLATDTLFVTRVATDACGRAGVLLLPTLPYGCSAFAINFPGTVSLRTGTLCAVLEDVVSSLYRQGFRRLVFLTGHGGNEVVTGCLSEVQLDRPELVAYYVNAWEGSRALICEIEASFQLPRSEHASWHENFPFTRLGTEPKGVRDFPSTPDFPIFPLNPRTARHYLGGGVVSGSLSIHDDEVMQQLYDACVARVAAFLEQLPPQSAVDP